MAFWAHCYPTLKTQKCSISCIKEAVTACFHLKYSCYSKEKKKKELFLSGAKRTSSNSIPYTMSIWIRLWQMMFTGTVQDIPSSFPLYRGLRFPHHPTSFYLWLRRADGFPCCLRPFPSSHTQGRVHKPSVKKLHFAGGQDNKTMLSFYKSSLAMFCDCPHKSLYEKYWYTILLYPFYYDIPWRRKL